MPPRSDAPVGPALLKPAGGSLDPGSARSLLMTILGELVWPAGQPAWTSALVYVLRGLGVEEQAARQAIARAAASAWMVPERRGREVCWSLGPRMIDIIEPGSRERQVPADDHSRRTGLAGRAARLDVGAGVRAQGTRRGGTGRVP